jgi:hypothetical protein
MTQRVFYAYPGDAPPKQAAWEPVPDDAHTLRHGYNLADLDRLTRAAFKRGWGLGYDYRTRDEVAWSAIVDRLYSAPDTAPPTPSDLIFAGQDGISGFVKEEMHHHGRAPGRGDLTQQRPRFAAFWEPRGHTGDPAGGVIERTALWQIWEQLTYTQRRILAALAAHGDYQRAADALGKTYATFTSEVSSARKRFFQLWHEHEKPSQVWGADRRVYRRGQAPVVERRLTAHDHLKQRKPRPAVTPEPEHGASRYQNGHCRCPVCVQAISALRLQQRRARGVQPRRVIGPEVRDQIYARRKAGVPVKQVAAEFEVSKPLVYKVMREARVVTAA